MAYGGVFMGGMKVWHVLILLALVGLVQAEIPTDLYVFASPQSPQNYGTSIMFFARYTVNGTLLDGVTLYIDNVPKTTTQTINGSVYTTVLTSGTHTWYFSASKAGYAPKNSTLGYYTINGSSGGGGSPLLRILKMEETPAISTDNTSWKLAIAIIAVIGLGIGYFVVRGAMFSTIPTAKVKKPKRK